MHRWFVVGGNAVDDILVEKVNLVGKAHIGVVHEQIVVDSIVGPLAECADFIPDFACIKQRSLVKSKVVVRIEATRPWLRALVLLGVGKRTHHHAANWRDVGVVVAIVPDIAVKFEFTAIGVQVRAESCCVAGVTGGSGLSGHARHGLCGRADCQGGNAQ